MRVEPTECDSIVENEYTTAEVENLYISMQQREMDTENDTERLLNIDERDELSVEDELVIAEILEVYRLGERMLILREQINDNLRI